MSRPRRKRKRSAVAEQERAAQVARDLADPRWQRIRIRNPSVGKWWCGVVIGGARGKSATRGVHGRACLVLYEDGEERVEDLDEVEWEDCAVASAPEKSSTGAASSSARASSSSSSAAPQGVPVAAAAAASSSSASASSSSSSAPSGVAVAAPRSSFKSKYIGVGWYKARKIWRVTIKVNGKVRRRSSLSVPFSLSLLSLSSLNLIFRLLAPLPPSRSSRLDTTTTRLSQRAHTMRLSLPTSSTSRSTFPTNPQRKGTSSPRRNHRASEV